MNHGDWAPIRYREFWDVPRIFLTTYGGQVYLFDCLFDEDIEDYPDNYDVFTMPVMTDEELAGSWADLSDKALARLGDVPVASVRFDPSKRKCIDPGILDELTSRKAAAG